jgi:hypothetical protein
MNLHDIKRLAMQIKLQYQLKLEKVDKIIELSESDETIPSEELTSMEESVTTNQVVKPQENVSNLSGTTNKNKAPVIIEDAHLVKNKIEAQRQLNTIGDEFDEKWTLEQKVKFFLYKVHKKAFHSSEFDDWLKTVEDNVEEKYGKSWSVNLGRLTLSSDIVAGWFNNSKRNVVYLPAEWQLDPKNIKPEYFPNPKAFGNMELSKRKITEFKGAMALR